MCDKHFGSYPLMRSHIKLVHKDQGVQCNLCNKYYCGKEKLRKHNILVHRTEIGSFHCDLCEKSYKQQCDLARHLKTHEHGKIGHLSFCRHV